MSKNELKEIIIDIQKKVEKSEQVKRETEQYTKKYGTLSESELHKRFTI